MVGEENEKLVFGFIKSSLYYLNVIEKFVIRGVSVLRNLWFYIFFVIFI